MTTDALTTFVSSRLEAVADTEKAAPMAAYMKTEMTFYGVKKAGRTPIVRDAVKRFPPSDRSSYEASVMALWILPHREEKYVALGFARAFPKYIDARSLSLYRRLVVEGAWWDLVDEVAIKLIGGALRTDRVEGTPFVRELVEEDDLWLRRTAIICQVGHKADTDTQLVEDAVVPNMSETDFFIRKAIGWILRDYAKTDPEWVRRFVDAHADELSGLSRREALKNL